MRSAVRILVANRPKLMRELILATLSDEPGIEIVGEVSDEADIRHQVRQTKPDLLVIALDEPAKTTRNLRHIAARPARPSHHRGRLARELQRILLGVVRYSLQPD